MTPRMRTTRVKKMTERREISLRKSSLISLINAEKRRHKEKMFDLAHELQLVDRELELAKFNITKGELRKLKDNLHKNRISMREISEKSGYSMNSCRILFKVNKSSSTQTIKTKKDILETANLLLAAKTLAGNSNEA